MTWSNVNLANPPPGSAKASSEAITKLQTKLD